jgi:hypothetical protein
MVSCPTFVVLRPSTDVVGYGRRSRWAKLTKVQGYLPGWASDNRPPLNSGPVKHGLRASGYFTGLNTRPYCRAVIANVNVISEIDSIETTTLYAATANLAHLLLRDTPPSAQVKAKTKCFRSRSYYKFIPDC